MKYSYITYPFPINTLQMISSLLLLMGAGEHYPREQSIPWLPLRSTYAVNVYLDIYIVFKDYGI